MIEWIAIGALAAGGAGYLGYRGLKRGKERGRWAEILADVAPLVNGRVSMGGGGDAPSLRATVDGQDLTLTLFEVQEGEAARARAELKIPGEHPRLRLCLAWDVLDPPAAMAHVPVWAEAPTHRLDGQAELRAEDTELATRFMEAALIDLIDLRAEALASGLLLTARGGYLTVELNGVQQTAALVERIVKVVPRLAEKIDASAS